jgi:hypothetical protein
MSERTRALEVLQQARETLSARLTELVLEQADDLLADARGESYMNEIDALYDQIGIKLAHISQMISNLPAGAVEPVTATAAAQHDEDDTFTVSTEAAPNADAVVEDTLLALNGPVYVATPALPPPRGEHSPRARATQLSLQAFAAQIQACDLLAAGRTLGALFDLEEPRAIACAATFAQRVRTEASYFRKVMQLRGEVQAGRHDRAEALLYDCFNLTRPDALDVLQTLRRRLKRED